MSARPHHPEGFSSIQRLTAVYWLDVWLSSREVFCRGAMRRANQLAMKHHLLSPRGFRKSGLGHFIIADRPNSSSGQSVHFYGSANDTARNTLLLPGGSPCCDSDHWRQAVDESWNRNRESGGRAARHVSQRLGQRSDQESERHVGMGQHHRHTAASTQGIWRERTKQ